MAFVIPALLPLVVFWIYPILRSLYLSFTDWDYMSSEYSIIGFKNYILRMHVFMKHYGIPLSLESEP